MLLETYLATFLVDIRHIMLAVRLVSRWHCDLEALSVRLVAIRLLTL